MLEDRIATRYCEWLQGRPKRCDEADIERLAAAVEQIAGDTGGDDAGFVSAETSPA